MPQCRRCHRDVEVDAKRCEYCLLENPLAEVKAEFPPRVTASGNQQQLARRLAIGGFLLVVIGGGIGAWVYRSSGNGAPPCDAPSLKSGVADVIHDNAVYELAPAVATRFPTTAFSTLSEIDGGGEGRAADHRACTATLQLSIDDRAMAFVATVNDPVAGAGVTPSEKALLTKYWHASARRLEIPITYAVAPGKAGSDSPWDLSLGDSSVAAIRDIVRIIARQK